MESRGLNSAVSLFGQSIEPKPTRNNGLLNINKVLFRVIEAGQRKQVEKNSINGKAVNNKEKATT